MIIAGVDLEGDDRGALRSLNRLEHGVDGEVAGGLTLGEIRQVGIHLDVGDSQLSSGRAVQDPADMFIALIADNGGRSDHGAHVIPGVGNHITSGIIDTVIIAGVDLEGDSHGTLGRLGVLGIDGVEVGVHPALVTPRILINQGFDILEGEGSGIRSQIVIQPALNPLVSVHGGCSYSPIGPKLQIRIPINRSTCIIGKSDIDQIMLRLRLGLLGIDGVEVGVHPALVTPRILINQGFDILEGEGSGIRSQIVIQPALNPLVSVHGGCSYSPIGPKLQIRIPINRSTCIIGKSDIDQIMLRFGLGFGLIITQKDIDPSVVFHPHIQLVAAYKNRVKFTAVKECSIDLDSLDIVRRHLMVPAFLGRPGDFNIADREIAIVPLIGVRTNGRAVSTVIIRVTFFLASNQGHTVNICNLVNSCAESIRHLIPYIAVHVVDAGMGSATGIDLSGINVNVLADNGVGGKLLAAAIVAVQLPADKDIVSAERGGAGHLIGQRGIACDIRHIVEFPNCCIGIQLCIEAHGVTFWSRVLLKMNISVVSITKGPCAVGDCKIIFVEDCLYCGCPISKTNSNTVDFTGDDPAGFSRPLRIRPYCIIT